MAEVDHTVINEGPTIIDANNSASPVPKIGHTNLGAEGERAMGRRHRAGLIDLAIRCSVAIKTGAIPTGFSGDDFDDVRDDPQLGLGELRCRGCIDLLDLCRRERCLQFRHLWLDDQIEGIQWFCTINSQKIACHHGQECSTP